MPTTAALISAIAKYERLGFNIDSLIDTFDAKGQGVACGKSFIPKGKKCSKDKAATTPKEALQRTKEKQKARQKLRAEVEGRPAKESKVAAKTVKLNTPENLKTVKRLLGGDDEMAANTIKQIEALDEVLPGSSDLFQKAMKEESISAKKTGIDSRIGTIAEYLTSGRKIGKRDLSQIGDAIDMAVSGGFSGKKGELDSAQQLLTNAINKLWNGGQLSESQKNTISRYSGLGDANDLKEAFKKTAIGKDLIKRQSTFKELQKKKQEGGDLWDDLF